MGIIEGYIAVLFVLTVEGSLYGRVVSPSDFLTAGDAGIFVKKTDCDAYAARRAAEAIQFASVAAVTPECLLSKVPSEFIQLQEDMEKTREEAESSKGDDV